MRKLGVALGLALLFVAGMAWATGGSLDGKTYVGKVGEKGKAAGDADELTFKDGKFHSKACDKYGFGDGPYTTKLQKGKKVFEAETKSEKEGTMKWTGTVSLDMISGTASWEKPGQAPSEHWFRAKEK